MLNGEELFGALEQPLLTRVCATVWLLVWAWAHSAFLDPLNPTGSPGQCREHAVVQPHLVEGGWCLVGKSPSFHTRKKLILLT